jgi:hypothetical protein
LSIAPSFPSRFVPTCRAFFVTFGGEFLQKGSSKTRHTLPRDSHPKDRLRATSRGEMFAHNHSTEKRRGLKHDHFRDKRIRADRRAGIVTMPQATS